MMTMLTARTSALCRPGLARSARPALRTIQTAVPVRAKADRSPGDQPQTQSQSGQSSSNVPVQSDRGNRQQRGVARRYQPSPLAPADLLTPSFGRLSDFMRDMQQEMDQMIRLLPVGPSLASDLFSPASQVPDLARLSMNVDIREDDKNYYISADVPGLRKDDIKIRVDGNHVLTITGQRKEEREEKDDQGNVERKERVVGTYLRQFQLPDDIDADHIQAKVDHGVLKLTIPKNEEAAKPRDIPVE